MTPDLQSPVSADVAGPVDPTSTPSPSPWVAFGRHRRSRVAYLALLRRSGANARRSLVIRSVAVIAILALSLLSVHWLPAILLCVLCAVGSYLMWANERNTRRNAPARFWLTAIYHRNVVRTDGRHRLSLGSQLRSAERPAADRHPLLGHRRRPDLGPVGDAGPGGGVLVSIVLLIFIDHTWFNPEETSPPAWHEMIRPVRRAGRHGARLRRWPCLPRGDAAAATAVVVIALTPMLITFRIMRHRPRPGRAAGAGARGVARRSRAGDQRAHGALSTHLRLLEQQARTVRGSAPALHELAVSANSRLREVLTLAAVDREDDASVHDLGAPVLTLARAVGAGPMSGCWSTASAWRTGTLPGSS